MREYLKFYVDGAWVDPATPKTFDVINPATEAVAGHISMGSAADVDRAVKAARRAFETYSQTSVDERIALLERVIAEYQKRHADMAAAITEEMGAPAALAQKAQAAMAEQIDVGKANTLADLRAVMQKILDRLAWLEKLHRM